MATESSARVQGTPRPGTLGYEAKDANIKWIFGLVAFLFASGIGIHFLLAWFQAGLEKTSTPPDRWTGSAAAQNLAAGLENSSQGAPPPTLTEQAGSGTPRPPRFPVLQVAPPKDLETFRAREEEALSNYGWVDQKSGVVRIPIERAMSLLLAKGLPVRSTNQAPPAGPSTYDLQWQRAAQPPKKPGER